MSTRQQNIPLVADEPCKISVWKIFTAGDGAMIMAAIKVIASGSCYL